eukprot:TRINITY_DN121385_c0_g1_i1.p1 TRINITY_DN121385_c0_g1~~TRINITY_DN121385_c0_g1_i1.p1  ORF type:complete len:372 (-),score=-28.32 TRINITY_DN121385_c0_g1_i1:27-1037(-)
MCSVPELFDIDDFSHSTEAYAYSCVDCKVVPLDPYVHIPCGRFYCNSCHHVERCSLCGEKFQGSCVLLRDWNPAMYQSFKLLEVKCGGSRLHYLGGCKWIGPLEKIEQHLVVDHGMIPRQPAQGTASLKATEENKSKGAEMVPCKYAEAGCNFVGTTAEKEEHEKEMNEYHLDIVWNYAQKLKTGVTSETVSSPTYDNFDEYRGYRGRGRPRGRRPVRYRGGYRRGEDERSRSRSPSYDSLDEELDYDGFPMPDYMECVGCRGRGYLPLMRMGYRGRFRGGPYDFMRGRRGRPYRGDIPMRRGRGFRQRGDQFQSTLCVQTIIVLDFIRWSVIKLS